MSEDVWSQRDTTPDAIEAALRELLRERHAANPHLAPARVLNLIVVVDRDWKGEIANRLERVGRYHASRTILCAVEEGRKTLDARALMRFEDPDSTGLGVMREQVEIDVGPDQLEHLGPIIDPVLVSGLTTMLWSPHGHQEAIRALLEMTDVILLDSDDEGDDGGLRMAEELRRSLYVVDLAWLRTTPWRERLAASFDPPERRAALTTIREVAIRHRPTSAASAALLAGWLCSRLGWQPGPLSAANGEGLVGEAQRGGEEVRIALTAQEQEAPGLAGVTVSWGERCALSLDRARGGLCANQRQPDGGEIRWQVLGASRGEGGILGEGVRQALLRDPTYLPALSAARSLQG